MTAAAIASVACTISGGTMFGSTCRERDAPRRIADRARGQHELLGLDGERLSARQPDEHRRRRDADRDHRVGQARAEERGERDREDQERAGEQRVGHPRDQHVRHAARVAGEQSDRHADRQRDQHRHDAGEQRRARAEDDARQHVAADLVGAEPVRGARRLADRVAARRERIVRRDDARRERHDDEAGDDDEADRRGGRRSSRRRPPSGRAARARSCRLRQRPRGDRCGGNGHCTRIRGLTTTYAMSASRFSTM